MYSKTNTTSEQLSAVERFKLIGILNSLPESQFDQVVMSLKPPPGVVPPSGTQIGKRTFSLLEWLEGSTGQGLDNLIVILGQIPNCNLEEIRSRIEPRFQLTLDIDADNIDINRLRQLINCLGTLIGDNSIRIIDVNQGSLKLDLTGDPNKLMHLMKLVENGEVTEVADVPIASVERIDNRDTNQWILLEGVGSSAASILAKRYFNEGQYKQAIPLYQENLAANRRVLGEDHPDVATSLDDLAILYTKQSLYNKAESLYKEALSIRKRLLGDKHCDIATSLSNLAWFYMILSRYDDAESLCVEALAMRKHLLGNKHSDIATSLNILAMIYNNQAVELSRDNEPSRHQLFNKAETLCREALSIRKRLSEDKLPEFATSLEYLAMVCCNKSALYGERKLYSEVENCYTEALEICRRVFRAEHPRIGDLLHNLAIFRQVQKRYSEADTSYLEALAIYKTIFGNQHPRVASLFYNLATLRQAQKRYGEAESFYRKALAIRKRVFGSQHPVVRLSEERLDSLHQAINVDTAIARSAIITNKSI